MTAPKLDKRTVEGLQRLRNNADFQLYAKHLTALYENCKDRLVACAPDSIQPLQGRATMLREILDDLKKETP